jgi:four helix bundle protein
MQESPIFTKTYDFLLWISQHVSRFPKSERFRLAKRIEDCAFSLYDAIMMAARHPETKNFWLVKADDELARLKVYLRIANNCQFSSPRQYHYAVGLILEIGKLLGGWMKKID